MLLCLNLICPEAKALYWCSGPYLLVGLKLRRAKPILETTNRQTIIKKKYKQPDKRLNPRDCEAEKYCHYKYKQAELFSKTNTNRQNLLFNNKCKQADKCCNYRYIQAEKNSNNNCICATKKPIYKLNQADKCFNERRKKRQKFCPITNKNRQTNYLIHNTNRETIV